MQEAIKKKYMTEEEYLEMEKTSDIKHEYYQGEVFAMAGASFKHNIIASNIIRELGIQLRKSPCRVLAGDMKVRIEKKNSFAYPDISVLCEEVQFYNNRQDIIENPQVIIEVLSDSTESYNKHEKFVYYRTLKSLKQYVLVSQEEERIEKYAKNENGFWVLSYTDETIREINLESINSNLNLDDVYEKVFN